MKAIGYVRVSTAEQRASGAGLGAQRAELERAAGARGWTLRLVEDSGRSARDLRRPGLQYALAELAAGRADALMISKLDRLSRSVLDFAGLLETARRQEWALVALDVADTSTPSGRAMASMVATFAQLERELIGQRTRDALAVKRAAGVRLGRPPAIPEPIRARIRAERAAGRSLRAIAAGLTAERVPTAHGGRQWYASTVSAVAK